MRVCEIAYVRKESIMYKNICCIWNDTSLTAFYFHFWSDFIDNSFTATEAGCDVAAGVVAACVLLLAIPICACTLLSAAAA